MKDWAIVSERGVAATVVPRASAQQPNYNAAASGRRLRTWRVPTSGPNTAVVGDLPIIRGRHRAAVRNDVWAGTALDKSVANGIGVGIQAKMVNGSDEEKASGNRVWNAFMKTADADGVLHHYGQQYLAWHEWDEAGEVFIRRRPRRLTDGLAVPLQIQIIEGEQCPADLNTIASNGNVVRAGIEFDSIGRRVAYWMYREHPGDMMMFAANRHELVRVPASEIIHLYRPLRAGQIRGIPDPVSAMVRMYNLDSMEDAVLERNRIANLFAGFFKYIGEENAADLIDEMSGGEEDVDGTPLAGLEPGTMQELPPGYEPMFTQPPSPGTDYAEFVRGHVMAIAARYGVPYEVLTGDLRNVSDRALRLILNEFRRWLEMKQWLFFIPSFCQGIRNWVFDAAWVAGALDIPDYPERREELLETLWVPHGWPYSHPVQDVTADVRAIRAGLDSRTASILRRGEDPEQVDAEIAADNERADRLGLVLDSDARKVSAAGLTQARPQGSVIPPSDTGGTDDDPDNEEDEDAQ